MNFKLAHACIRVQDLEKSLAFYTHALGFQETRRLDFPEWKFTLVYLTDMTGHFEIEITYNYDTEHPYELGTGFSHFAVYTPELDKARATHVQSGYTVTEIKDLGDGQARYYFISDPDGYRTEIIEQAI